MEEDSKLSEEGASQVEPAVGKHKVVEKQG
jgi:hypothetical protein